MSPRMPRDILALPLGLIVVMSFAAAAFAQEPLEEAAISLRLSPAILEVAHDAPGGDHQLRVENTGTERLRIETEVSEFRVTPDGTTEFEGAENLSAAAWVTVKTPVFDIAPGAARDVSLAVAVPDDAEPGERYGSVIFAVPPKASDGNITATHRLATKLYIDVPGRAVENLELGTLSGPRLVDSGAARFELTVHNRGNVHRRFEEATRLLATSGDSKFAFQNFTVLGESTRKVEAMWAEPPTFCWCSIAVETDDGQGNILSASTRVLMFPLRLTLAGVAAVIGLGMLLAASRRRRAQRLEQLLAQARQEGLSEQRRIPTGV